MEYKVVTVQVQMPGFFNAWSLDGTSSEELFYRAQQDYSKIIHKSEVDTTDYSFADALLEGTKDGLRSYILTTQSPIAELNGITCVIGYVYIVETDDKNISTIVNWYVKRPEFSLEQLAKDLCGDFIYNHYVALGDSRNDVYPYPNMREKFVAACARWWDLHDHYSFFSKLEVLDACRKIGTQNNLQTFFCS